RPFNAAVIDDCSQRYTRPPGWPTVNFIEISCHVLHRVVFRLCGRLAGQKALRELQFRLGDLAYGFHDPVDVFSRNMPVGCKHGDGCKFTDSDASPGKCSARKWNNAD